MIYSIYRSRCGWKIYKDTTYDDPSCVCTEERRTEHCAIYVGCIVKDTKMQYRIQKHVPYEDPRFDDPRYNHSRCGSNIHQYIYTPIYIYMTLQDAMIQDTPIYIYIYMTLQDAMIQDTPIYIIKIKIHSSCEIEDFVETHPIYI